MKNLKKPLVLAALLLVGLGTAPMVSHVAAKDHGQKGGFSGPSVSGGYKGPGPAVMTIKEAASQADDSWVTFRGNIINHKGDDKYTFQDASGTGIVEIDRKAWHGAQVGPENTVELLVEVDKDWGSTEFEAKSVKIVK